jgi:hypothetical protein
MSFIFHKYLYRFWGFAVVVLDNPLDKVCGVQKGPFVPAGRDVGLAGDLARRAPVE